MKFISTASERDFTALREYLSNEVGPKVLGWDRDERFPVEVFGTFHEMGLMEIGWPRSGGLSWKMIDLLEIASELGYHSPAIFTSWIGNLLVQTAISRFGSEEMIARVAREQAAGRTLLSFCATELASGTDVFAMSTTAEPVSGGFVITGKKHFITNANYASHLVVFANAPTTRPDGLSEMTAFLVPAASPGLRVTAPLHKLGQRESNTTAVELSGVRVPTEARIGNFGDGYRILMACVSRTKTLISGAAVGVCRRAEAEAVEYLRVTHRYREPLLARRELQFLLAGLRTAREAAWLLACRAGAVWDEKGIAVCESSMAKVFATDLATKFVSEALELTGATGYMQESFLSKLYRDVKVMEIYEGASMVQHNLIAKELYGSVLKAATPSPDRRKAEL